MEGVVDVDIAFDFEAVLRRFRGGLSDAVCRVKQGLQEIAIGNGNGLRDVLICIYVSGNCGSVQCHGHQGHVSVKRLLFGFE